MLEPIKFRVEYEDASMAEGRIELPDQIAIERNYDCSILHLFTSESHVAERIAYGAWHSLRRKKQVPQTTEFDPWFNTVVLIHNAAEDPDVFEETPDPKAEAKDQPPAGSPSSPTD